MMYEVTVNYFIVCIHLYIINNVFLQTSIFTDKGRRDCM